MFEQYLAVKAEYPDALLFFRMGDFFELFFDDAEIASKELQLTLTSRNPGAEQPIPMAGVPHHALESYIPQLLEKGFNIVVCDQLENPKDAKGLVKRGVTRILTPGTVVEEASLSGKGGNFLGAFFWDKDKGRGGFAWADNSTGAWTGLESGREAELWQWIQKISPRELLLPLWPGEKPRVPASVALDEIRLVSVPQNAFFSPKAAEEKILAAQGVRDLGSLGLAGKKELTQACGALLAYLERTQKDLATHLAPFRPLNPGKHLIIDEVTERNLELFRRLDGKKGPGTLWQVLNETITPMGARLLEETLRQPWREAPIIQETQSLVAHFFEQPEKLKALREQLKKVHDLERLSTRIFLNRAYPRDFTALAQSLAHLPGIYELLRQSRGQGGAYQSADEASGRALPPRLLGLLEHWDGLDELSALLGRALAENPPLTVTEGGLFRQGYNAELDELMDLAEHGEARIAELLENERSRWNLPKLKIGHNRVFGYYFELSRMSSDKAPDHFVRRQTLANAERYTTPDLNALEQKMVSASERRNSLEYSLFQELRGIVAAARPRLMFMAHCLALLDFWQGLAHCARLNNWTRPQISQGQGLRIRQGRHPVVEQIQGRGNFIPNDLIMDERRRIILITGPNMSGKSTVLRQTALICLLAQMGSYVPAAEAEIGLADRIFSRVGASDNLAQGQSTFMVEMMETARILRQAGRKSLVILDEIGRGTSTYDGLALAWAVVEDLAGKYGEGVRTLFATHYHELTVLDGTLPGVHNMNVAIREQGGELLFLRRLVPGPSDRSYGIEVARLAGVPDAVVRRARQILARLDKPDRPGGRQGGKPGQAGGAEAEIRAATLPGLSLPAPDAEEAEEKPLLPPPRHPVLEALADLDVNNTSPMRALEILQDWKLLWGEENHE
ncbi:DNA mismatch repair protein MutS [Desulfovibrio sp. OttesenSCG-928-C14]|nr:DNA mismatch repair protein MutS [Desulfovibrio sp. OttesenSCG-928-C14]